VKKTYVKPALYLEDFKLSTNIAACGIKLGATEETCSYTIYAGMPPFIAPIILFSGVNASCTTTMDNQPQYCTEAPTSATNIFAS